MLFSKRPGAASASLVLVLALVGCKSKQKKPANDGEPVTVDKDKELATECRKAQDSLDEGTLAEGNSDFVKARDLYLRAKTTYPDADKDSAAFKAKVDQKLSGLEEIVVAQQDLEGASAAPDTKKAELEVRLRRRAPQAGRVSEGARPSSEGDQAQPDARVGAHDARDPRVRAGDLKGSLDRANKVSRRTRPRPTSTTSSPS